MTKSKFLRADGPEKVTGQARYTADLVLPGVLDGRFLLAGRARARIRRLDTAVAERLPGVMAVITQRDVPKLRYGSAVKDRTLFADGEVRFEGEVVAAVAARTPEIAAAAIDLIEVEYEDLPPITDPRAALDAGSELVHPDWRSYDTAYDGLEREGNDCARVTIVKGDIAAGLAAADHVVEGRYSCAQSHPVPIEPHGVVAQWQGERVTIWTSTQVPFAARAGVAETLQMPESNVRIIVPYLGGGFGGKCEFHFEAHVAALARKAGRPVRVIFSRHDEFVAPDKVNHPMYIDLRTGVRSDGAITAHSARIVMDTGAYASDAPAIAEIATMMAAGPYDIDNLDIEARTVYTNKTPAGSVRAPSGPQVVWALEQHIDEVGRQVGLNGYEMRLRNLLEDGDEGPTGQRMTAVGVKTCLEQAANAIGYSRERGDGEGVGLACGWWFTFAAASSVTLKLNTDGSATLITGAQENGSGAVMGLALMVGEELGIGADRVSVLYQDTDAGSWDMGSSGSQTTYNNGRAVIAATGRLRDRVLQLAGEKLEASAEDLEMADGVVSVRGVPATSMTIAEVAAHAFANGELLIAQGAADAVSMPENLGASCAGRVVFPAFIDPTFVCQAVRASVDKESGVVHVAEVAAAHDFGHVINPQGARGQVEGGILQGLGYGLTEGSIYRDGRQLNAHLLDYKLLTAADAPSMHIDFVETQAVSGPRGAKGVGEPPIIVAAAAAANAIAAVTGARVRELPMTPPAVWAAINGGDDR